MPDNTTRTTPSPSIWKQITDGLGLTTPYAEQEREAQIAAHNAAGKFLFSQFNGEIGKHLSNLKKLSADDFSNKSHPSLQGIPLDVEGKECVKTLSFTYHDGTKEVKKSLLPPDKDLGFDEWKALIARASGVVKANTSSLKDVNSIRSDYTKQIANLLKIQLQREATKAEIEEKALDVLNHTHLKMIRKDDGKGELGGEERGNQKYSFKHFINIGTDPNDINMRADDLKNKCKDQVDLDSKQRSEPQVQTHQVNLQQDEWREELNKQKSDVSRLREDLEALLQSFNGLHVFPDEKQSIKLHDMLIKIDEMDSAIDKQLKTQVQDAEQMQQQNKSLSDIGGQIEDITNELMEKELS